MEGPKKLINSAALNALTDALTNIYWYKADQKRFILSVVNDPAITLRIEWDGLKRTIASQTVGILSNSQHLYQEYLLKLMTEVCQINDFSHLEVLQDSKEKISKAKNSVQAVKKQMTGHLGLIEELNKQEERKVAAKEKITQVQDSSHKLEEIKKDFLQLVTSTDKQARGYKLEKILKELFMLFDLDPKAAFRITGEQIDGAFTFENSDYLLEAKWKEQPSDIGELDAFQSKILRKLDNTLGLFCSINGFSPDSLNAHSAGKKLMLLMDGADLMAVLESRIDLIALLSRKRKHAAQTGNIYLTVKDILTDQ